MSLLFWLLIFNYYANIYAPSVEESLDLFQFTNLLARDDDRRESRPYDALIMITEHSPATDKTVYYLPEKIRVKSNRASSSTTQPTSELVFLTRNHKHDMGIEFLCAIDIQHNAEHRGVIEKLKNYFSGFQYCLVKVEFPHNAARICPSEAIPLVVPMLSKQNHITEIKSCGPNLEYEYLQFAFPYCESISAIEEFLRKIWAPSTPWEEDDVKPLFTADIPMLELYSICFDVKDIGVVYTHHHIFPSLVKDENLLANSNSANTSPKIPPPPRQQHKANSPNTHQFSHPLQPKQTVSETSKPQFYHEKFRKYEYMKNAFANQASTEYHMQPQMLVPTADMPFPLWKKSTFSYINIAPLWDQLVPLMDLINDRIRQFAIKRSKKLSIYTTAFDVVFDDYDILYLDRDGKLPIPNVWSKLVHDEESKTATAILLHNTPGNDFKSSRLCAWNQEVACNFTDWWRTSSQKNTIDQMVIKETARYAYCCQVRTTNILGEYYGMDDYIAGDIVNIE